MQSARAFLFALGMCSLSMLGQTGPEFSSQVQPILKKRCEACHGAAQQLSGLRLDQRDAAMAGGYSGPIIVPGKSAESKIIQRVTGAPGVMVMPPSGPKLTPEEIATLKGWIDSGAKWNTTAPAGAQSQAQPRHSALGVSADRRTPAAECQPIGLGSKSSRYFCPQQAGARENLSIA